MNSAKRRVVGYGAGCVLAGALLYLGFVHARHIKADIDTLVGTAEIRLRLATSMSATDKDGKPTQVRVDLIRQAREALDDADAQQADYPPARELRAHLLYMEGSYAEAAEIYAWLWECKSCTAEQRDLFALNASRMLRAAGDAKAAERAWNAQSQQFLAENAAESQIERAHVLLALGRNSEAVEVMTRLVSETEAPMVLLAAALFLERQGQMDVADSAYQKAASAEPIADYYRARLKVKQEEYDTGMDLLERAMRATAARVRDLLRQDHEIWSPWASTKRFRDLLELVSEAAQPGR